VEVFQVSPEGGIVAYSRKAFDFGLVDEMEEIVHTCPP